MAIVEKRSGGSRRCLKQADQLRDRAQELQKAKQASTSRRQRLTADLPDHQRSGRRGLFTRWDSPSPYASVIDLAVFAGPVEALAGLKGPPRAAGGG